MTLLSFLVTLASAVTPVHLTVDGDGYLRLMRDGRAVYAKSATLTTLPDGRLGTAAGDSVLPSIQVPSDALSLEVDLEGQVFAISGGRLPIGRLVLALFPAGAALSDRGGVLLAADRPRLGNPGEGTNGVIRTGGTKSARPTVQPQPTTSQPAPAGGKARVTARAEAEVAGENIRLGDIATIEANEPLQTNLTQLDLGETPAFGARRVLDRMRILARLKAAGIASDSVELIVPASVNVTRQSQVVTHATFLAFAEKTVREAPNVAAEYVADDVAPDFKAPQGELKLISEGIVGLNTTNCQVKIAVFVDGKRINSRTVKLTATALPETIKSGTVVKVRFLAGGALIEMTGITRTAGKVGDQVSVEVRPEGAERTLHMARIIAAGVVEVKL